MIKAAHRCYSLFLFTVLYLVFQSSPAFCQYSGGDGSVTDPYMISNANDWQQLMANINHWSTIKYFILTADVNLAGIDISPIGNSTKYFNGKFDGNNHVIRNVSINKPNEIYVGLFGRVNNGEIKNLGVEDVNILGSNYVGGLVGYFYYGQTLISNCHTSGSVNATNASDLESYAGGLIGYNESNKSIDNCFSTCSVYCSASSVYAGGLIGYNYSAISNCYATGSVFSPSANVRIGGLLGWNNDRIDACYATGAVSAPFSSAGSDIGGLIGDGWSEIWNCYAKGSVSGKYGSIGGLIGTAETIYNCYSTGQVSGSSVVGGLTSSSIKYVADSFWDKETSGQTRSGGGTGLTTAEMKKISSFRPNWRFADQNATTSSPWLMPDGDYPILAWQLYKTVALPSLKGLTVSQAETKLNQLQITQGKSYLSYDSTIQPGLVARTIPYFSSTPTSPTKVYQGLTKVHLVIAKDYKYSGGDGSASNPYKISDIDNLQELSFMYNLSDNFILTADINCMEHPFKQMCNNSLTGVFDGNEHMISNIVIDQSHDQNYGGLFRYSNGQIKNLHIENINLKGSETITSGFGVGGLIGINYGIIKNCSVTGKAFASAVSNLYVGGLAGLNYGTISNCSAKFSFDAYTPVSSSKCNAGGLVGYNEGTISTSHAAGSIKVLENFFSANIGGLAGENTATINNCYATGAVSSFDTSTYAGGFVGSNSGTINNCYAAGAVFSSYINITPKGFVGYNYPGTVTGSFWNKETTGCLTGGAAGSTELTEQQMKTLSIFTSANWDFVNIWDMGNNQTYPYLRQTSATDINQDNKVDYSDFNLLAENWLSGI